ncbi:hypothetical protein HCA61_04460 [Rhodococcus sp. HNM0563]|uniref:Rv0361 family membrane protein n=1 Tax=unclassified Rhodococcus (in: high G+C Gram-positive bacteria) TaxID=192944 RepID=UPI001469B0AF|nr:MULTISPECIES: hypothetical protein [unclassified Rhodococcus (in: high G+C Gram-positive bacteria)]MCK0090307.1 hypothetical protein [Rhodococcus sp. F64268]NLU61515.1 hypothetical protein [Rhodococcus sp. HNM0563]
MAQRRDPEPEPDGLDPDGPTRSTPWPFIGAVLVIAFLALVLVVTQILSPEGENLDDNERITRTASDYVKALNADDEDVLVILRCGELGRGEGPLAGVDGDIDLQRSDNVVIDGDKATVDVTTEIDGESTTETWHLTLVDDVWRVCTA